MTHRSGSENREICFIYRLRLSHVWAVATTRILNTTFRIIPYIHTNIYEIMFWRIYCSRISFKIIVKALLKFQTNIKILDNFIFVKFGAQWLLFNKFSLCSANIGMTFFTIKVWQNKLLTPTLYYAHQRLIAYSSERVHIVQYNITNNEIVMRLVMVDVYVGSWINSTSNKIWIKNAISIKNEETSPTCYGCTFDHNAIFVT